MEIQLKRPIFIGFIFTLYLNESFGQTTIKGITDEFIASYQKDPTKTADYGFSTNKWGTQKQEEVSGLRDKLKDLISLCFEYNVHELLSETIDGQNLKMVTFIVRSEREPIPFTSHFYEPNTILKSNNFSFDEDIDKDLEEATKAYRLKETFYNMNIDTDRIVNEVRPLFEDLTRYSENAKLDSFLRCYSETPDFLAVSGDGIIRNYEDFKKIAKDYYDSLKAQKLTTTHEIYQVLDGLTVLLCWSGNIDAFFKNGDVWKMPNYSLTFIFKKISGEWKIIHSHESSLPPQIIKSK